MWISFARGLFILALAFVAFAVVDACAVRSRLADGVRTDGEVVSVRKDTHYERHSSGIGDVATPVDMHVATVRYTDDAGGVHTIVTDPLSREFRTGDDVPVIYPRDDPQDAMLLVAGSPWDRPLSLVGVAAVFGTFALLAYVLGRARGEGGESKQPPGRGPERLSI